MKKALILAYDFPPYVSVGGLRPFSWFKYMPEFGVFPIMVTRQWSNEYKNHLDYIAPSKSSETIVETFDDGTIIRTPYFPNLANKILLKHGDSKFKFFRKGISVFYEYVQFIFPVGTKSNIYSEANKYLAKNKVDIIIATGEPYVLFKYASDLSEKYDIPWIADYRDPWSQDKNRQFKGFPRFLDDLLERKILQSADAVTSVSDFFCNQLSKIFPSKSLYAISNGYDENEVEKVKNIKQTKEKFSIAVVGTIYKWHPVESFLRACSEFTRELPNPPKFELNFYGINLAEEIENLIETKFKELKTVTKIHPKISNAQVLKKMAENNVFLLFNQYTSAGTKIYNYLALKRLILFCYTDDKEASELKEKFYNIEELGFETENPQISMIKNTNSGIFIKDENHLKNVLNELYGQFSEKGFISCDSFNTEQFSRKIQAKKLVEVINKTLENTENK